MKTYAEIADELGITELEAKNIAHNAMNKIRKNMSQQKQEEIRDMLKPIPEPTNEELDSILREIEDRKRYQLVDDVDNFEQDEDVLIAEEEGY